MIINLELFLRLCYCDVGSPALFIVIFAFLIKYGLMESSSNVARVANQHFMEYRERMILGKFHLSEKWPAESIGDYFSMHSIVTEREYF
jgi:hypothetical protein